ncbi:MAG: hypothetical protein ACM3U1_01300 [Chloroflexota bacterium]
MWLVHLIVAYLSFAASVYIVRNLYPESAPIFVMDGMFPKYKDKKTSFRVHGLMLILVLVYIDFFYLVNHFSK